MEPHWEIPRTWGTKSLADVAPENSRQTRPADQPNTIVNYWSLDAINKDQFTEPDVNLVRGSEIQSTCVEFDTSHVLYGKLRPYLNKVIVPSQSGVGSTEWVPLRPIFELLDREYLAYVLRTKVFVDYATSNSIGARMPRAKKEALRVAAIPIPYPDDPPRSLAEQRRIVARLEALLGEVRELRQLQAEIEADVGRLMEAVLAEMFGKAEEQNWTSHNLDDLVENHDHKRIPVRKADRENMRGEYPYYGATGIIDFVDSYLFDGEYLLVSEDGANLVARKYPIAFIAEGKFWVNNHAHVVRATDVTSNQYLVYAIAATDISRLVTGAAQPKLNQENMNSIPIWLPSNRTHQDWIVSYLNEVQSEVDEMLRTEAENRHLLDDMEQAVLAQAFRGEL